MIPSERFRSREVYRKPRASGDDPEPEAPADDAGE